MHEVAGGQVLYLYDDLVLFTSWFFSPAFLERVIVFLGSKCIATLPSREHFTTLTEFCCAKSTLTPKTRLELSAIVSKFNVVPNMRGNMARQPKVEEGAWYFETYFLLTMSILFLADQLRLSFSNRAANGWSQTHMWAVVAQISLIAIWLCGVYHRCVLLFFV